MARTPAKRKNDSSSVENLPRTGPGPSPGHHVAGRPSPPFHLTANDRGPATPVGRSRPPKYAIDDNMLPPGQQLPSSLAQNASTGGARVAGIQLGNCGDINLPSMSNGGRSSLSVKSSDQDNDHERSSSARAASKYDARLNLSSLPRTDTPRGDSSRIPQGPCTDAACPPHGRPFSSFETEQPSSCEHEFSSFNYDHRNHEVDAINSFSRVSKFLEVESQC